MMKAGPVRGSGKSVDRYRRRGLVVAIGALTVGSVVIVGCSGAVEGSPTPNRVQAAAYQAEVTASIAASSSKAAADAVEIAFQTCEELIRRSKDDVAVFNAYIDANNNDESDVTSKAQAAASSADEFAGWLDTATADVPASLSGLFGDLADNLRSIAGVVKRDHSPDEINSITDTTNSIRDSIRTECGAL
ncbi:hypothetical protein [Rhodococcus globerulus]|uniref:hypothetical protein n=1 Tax=Rhodococcus globerulus TaxID=33008 RepID=UPI002165B865|nr:hypothetical protein [Rhodococcus globerulus]